MYISKKNQKNMMKITMMKNMLIKKFLKKEQNLKMSREYMRKKSMGKNNDI